MHTWISSETIRCADFRTKQLTSPRRERERYGTRGRQVTEKLIYIVLFSYVLVTNRSALITENYLGIAVSNYTRKPSKST